MRRGARRVFDADEARLAGLVRGILDDDPIYWETTESAAGMTFATTVRPNLLFAKTGMRVRVEGDGGGAVARAVVDVTTVSQPFVLADGFGLYDRYIREFFEALDRRIADPATTHAVRPGFRGLAATWHGRFTLVSVGVLLALLVVLPAVLALAGLERPALHLLFQPFGVVAGLALARLVSWVRRRFGLIVAAPAAVLGLAAALAVSLAVGLVVSFALPGGEGPAPTPASGLSVGVVLGVLVGAGPAGFEGECSEERDVRGPRGILLGARRWFSGGPLFEGSVTILAFAVLSALPFVALGAFALAQGLYHDPLILSLLALGLGNLLLGIAETVPLGLRRASAAARGAGLLAGLVCFPALLLLGVAG